MNETDRATKAKAVLDSPAYQEAYSAVRAAIFASMEACSLKDTETAEDFRRCLKLLRDVQANMVAALQAGKLAEFRLERQKAESNNPFRKIFRDKQ